MSVPASVPKRSESHLLRRFSRSEERNWKSFSSNSTTSPIFPRHHSLGHILLIYFRDTTRRRVGPFPYPPIKEKGEPNSSPFILRLLSGTLLYFKIELPQIHRYQHPVEEGED